MEIKIVSEVTPECRESWEALWQTSGATPFSHPAWCLDVNRATQKQIVFGYLSGELALVMPLYQKKRKLRVLGGDYEDFICSPRLTSSELTNGLQQLFKRLRARSLEVRHVSPESRLLQLLPSLKVPGFAALIMPHTEFPALQVPKTWPEVEAFLGKAFWSTTARKERKRQRELPGYLVRTARQETLDQDLQQLYQLHQERQAAKGNPGIFGEAETKVAFAKFSRQMLEQGRLHLYSMLCEEGPIASFYCLRTGPTVHYYTGGFSEAFAKHSPSHGLITQAARDCVANNDLFLDFMMGQEDYKQRWCNFGIPVSRVVICRAVSLERLKAMALRAQPAVKAWFKRAARPTSANKIRDES